MSARHWFFLERPSSIFERLSGVTLHPTSTRAKTASQADLPLAGRISVPVRVADQTHVISMYVSDSIDVQCILGLDFLRSVPCVIDLTNRRLVLVSGDSVRSVSVDRTSVGCAVLGCDVSLPPGSECFVQGRVHHCDYEGEVLVEPSLDAPGVEVVRCVAMVKGSSLPLLIRNLTTDSITLPKHSEIADLEVGFAEEDVPERDGADAPVDIESVVSLDGSCLSEVQREALMNVLKKHERMFDGHVGHTNLVTHRIDTGNSPPIRQSPRRIPPHLTEPVRDELNKLVSEGILEESDGGWASPICLVRKKNWRVACVCRHAEAELRHSSSCLPDSPH